MKNNSKTKRKYIWGNTVAHEWQQGDGAHSFKNLHYLDTTFLQVDEIVFKSYTWNHTIHKCRRYVTMSIMMMFITIGVVWTVKKERAVHPKRIRDRTTKEHLVVGVHYRPPEGCREAYWWGCFPSAAGGVTLAGIYPGGGSSGPTSKGQHLSSGGGPRPAHSVSDVLRRAEQRGLSPPLRSCLSAAAD